MAKSIFVRSLLSLCATTSSALLIVQLASCGGDDTGPASAADGSVDQTSEPTPETGSDSTTDSHVDALVDSRPDNTVTGETGPDGAGDADASAADAPAETGDADAESAKDADAMTADADAMAMDADAMADADAAPADADAAGQGDADSGGDGDAAGCAIAVPPMGSFSDTLASVACSHIRDCCGLTASNFDMTKCANTFSAQNGGWLGVGQVVPFFDGGNVAYDQTVACQCLVATSSYNCGTVSQTDFTTLQSTCFAAVGGTAPANGACKSSYECAPGLYCAPVGDSGTGACMALVTDGGDCSSVFPSTEAKDFACSYRRNPTPPLECDTTSKTCAPRSPTGSPCNRSAVCTSNRCLFANGAVTCATGPISTSPQSCTFFTLQDAGGD
ncbi:MAG TPA: hypothetical protein VGY54_23495 [Polyangiaceae bacterium]|jgi:hypothetical protein|nr:hypothetical protein [Polyangiaceae bacterium]